MVASATASFVDSLDICLANARNPRNPESQVVAAAVAMTASNVDSLVTCHVSVTSPGSLENQKDLAADLEEDLDLSSLFQ